ncbi:MAG: hypothetical protein EA350_13430 [Gemmatimonadales bacterium]|nr:MAG: hypothetical protein EA350_13430 [Gemmatimonadales bacterium]
MEVLRSSPRMRMVVSDPGYAYSRPCFSPGGDRILFMRTPVSASAGTVARDNGSPWSLWTVPVEGGEMRPALVDASLSATRPDWCPVSGRIVFTGIREGRPELWLLDGDGGTPTRVDVGVLPDARFFYPSWFPDGKRLLVTDYSTHQVHAVDLEGGHARPLTDPAKVWAGMAVACCNAGNGERVAFAGQLPGGRFHPGRNTIWIQEARGEATPLDRLPGRMPAWSRMGDSLVFTAPRWRSWSRLDVRRFVRPPSTLYLQRMGPWPAAAGPARPLTALRVHASHAKWAPDGRRLVCNLGIRWGGPSGIGVIDVAPSGQPRPSRITSL